METLHRFEIPNSTSRRRYLPNCFGGIEIRKTDEKLRVIFNAIILSVSILAVLFITIVWEITDSSVILSYILSTLVSLLVFHQLKVGFLKHRSSNVEEPLEMRFPLGAGKRQTFLLFLAIALIMATPLVILFLIPRLWLIILDGIVSGATLSEIVIYLQRDETTK